MGMMDGPRKPVCPRCSEPIPEGKLVVMCLKCVRELLIANVRMREWEALREKPNLTLKMAPVGSFRLTRAKHIVFSVDNRFTYCGQEPTGPKSKWEPWHMVKDQDVCETCRKLRAQFLAPADETMEAKS